ncbi:MAG: nucleotide exchange factor GrpE [Nitrososphaerales archaeon]
MAATDTKQDGERANQDAQSHEEAKPDPVEERIRKFQTELEEERKRSSELSKRMLYLQADMLNLQKQSDRMESQAREDATLRYVLELASIKEDLERALSVAGKDIPPTVRDGLSMLLLRIDSDLRAESVERITVNPGSDFDPRVHEAVAYTEAKDRKDGCVLSIVGNGYTCRGKVIKPALVEVARQNPSSREHRKESQTNGNAGVEEQIEVGTSTVGERQAKSP